MSYLAYKTDFSGLRLTQQNKLRTQYLKFPASFFELAPSDLKFIIGQIEQFYRKELAKSHANGFVVGLSGGLDSAVVAYLTCKAVGPDKVFGVLLPSKHTVEKDLFDALDICKKLGIKHNDYRLVQTKFDSIIQELENCGETHPDTSVQKIKLANLQARVRMIILRDIARAKGYLVAGTGNRSEILTGYFTVGGDGVGGVDNEALGNLFKTEERSMARYLRVPVAVIDKTPSAGLWPGQSDEQELGVGYKLLDQILVGYLLQITPAEIEKVLNKETALKQIESVFNRVEKNKFKNQSLPMAKFNL